jgi:hypothetical protein
MTDKHVLQTGKIDCRSNVAIPFKARGVHARRKEVSYSQSWREYPAATAGYHGGARRKFRVCAEMAD